MDLFYVDKLKSENDGIKYILTAIDVYTRFGFCEPIINKSASEVISKLQLILNRLGVLPNIVCSDQGAEFKNKYITKFLKEHKIKSVYAQTEPK